MVEGRAVTLVLGGARSGKSEVAERLVAARGLPVTYVATGAAAGGDDPDWSARIAAHRARRPPTWRTTELAAGVDLGELLRAVPGAALVDSLGTWVAGCDAFSAPVDSLCQALVDRSGDGRPTVLVSEEVGLGVHPPTDAGRKFADALGSVNQEVARVAGRVLLVVAGRALELRAAESDMGAGSP